jgi:glyoxylase-like metal-dependent hydrolase (beta-lactamase superfamily II)
MIDDDDDATPPDWHVWQVRYATREARKGYVFHDYRQYGLPDGTIPMEYSFWVIRSAGRTILFDTGYHVPDYAEHDEVALVSPPDALAMLGIDPLEVDTVVCSQFHYDHIGYLYLFGNADVVAHRLEREEWFAKWTSGDLGPHVWPKHLEAVAVAEREGRLRLIEGEFELEPGLVIHTIGGHSPGQVVLGVHAKSGSFLLASDAAHFSEEIDNGWPFFAFDDLQVMRDGLALVRRLADETGSIVIPGHDGRTRRAYPPVPGAGGQVAVALS